MIRAKQLRKLALVAGDLTLLYLSLFLTLLIRYGSLPSEQIWSIHKWPFFVVYISWLVILYISDLYDINKFISSRSLESQLIKTMVFAGVISIIIFYAIPFFLIAPKTNLLINLVMATAMLWLWRKVFYSTVSKTSKVKILFLGESDEVTELIDFINQRPQLGYQPAGVLMAGKVKSDLREEIKNQNIGLVVALDEIRSDRELTKALYDILPMGVTIINFDKFYEAITGKIPVHQISESWFLENLIELNKQSFEKIKEWLDFVLAIMLLLVLIAVSPFIGLAIKINSRGPILYKQKRVGKNGKVFELIKFRSMIDNAEQHGAQWAKQGDTRVTAIGNILRKTRLDELPQIWNVVKGDLSFVGPRPERPEFVKKLKEQIPFYSARHLIRPGLSGWAQINFPYGASVEDATEKLQYDLYYIKNRSVLLDFVIALKTIAIILRRQGR